MIYIRTAGKTGEEIEKHITDNYQEKTVFVDRDYHMCNGKDIVSIYYFVNKYKKGDCLIIPSTFLDKEEVDFFTYMGILKDDIKIYYDGKLNDYNRFTHLEYLEFHINDHCNLNCKGCSHFCPLVREEVFADLNQLKKDFIRLRQLITHIKMIRIMGGEPLLNNNLDECIEIVRSNYPYSDIRIVTNGLLINNLTDDIWNSIHENNIKIDISIYPPLIQRADEMLSIIKDHGVEIGSIRNVSSFEKILHDKQEILWNNISSCTCNNLHNGYIASCQLVFYGKYFNDYFKKNIPFESGKIDLYNAELNGKNLMEMLDKPFEACKYCNQATFGINSTIIGWKHCNNIDECNESDWLVKGV